MTGSDPTLDASEKQGFNAYIHVDVVLRNLSWSTTAKATWLLLLAHFSFFVRIYCEWSLAATLIQLLRDLFSGLELNLFGGKSCPQKYLHFLH